MAASPSSSIFSTSFPLATPTLKTHISKPHLSFTTRATDPESPPSEPSSPESQTAADSSADDFDNRLSQVRLRYRSGTGKKAEQRKVRKSKTGSPSGSGSGSGSNSNSSMYLPAVPLKEPVSGGLKVNFGFSPYSEKINGWMAMIGLSALLLVELATGKSVLNYHTPSVILIQIYFVTAMGALYIKYEKERKSIWPQ